MSTVVRVLIFKVSCIAGTIFLIWTTTAKANPPWFKENIKRDGNSLTVACVGGPSIAVDISVKLALDQCNSIATQYVKGYSFQSRSLTVEDNQEANLFSELSSELQVTGLVCKNIRSATEENKADDTFKTYLMCRFDLSKAKATPIADNASNDKEEAQSDGLIQDKETVSSVPETKRELQRQELVQGEARSLVLSSVPVMAQILIVRGAKPRSIRIKENPQTIVIFSGDREVILKAKGFKPKRIFLNQERSPASSFETEKLDVFLEK